MNRLRNLRNEKKLTLRELGEVTMISYSSLSSMENGIRDITGNNLLTLASFFNVTTDYLLGISDVRNASSDIKLDEFEVAFHGEVKDLSDDAKEKVLEYARLLKMKEDSKK